MPSDIELSFWLVSWLENNRCIFILWLSVGFVVSLLNFLRILNWRLYKEIELKHPKLPPIPYEEKLWEASINFIFQFIGFPLLYVSLIILLRLEHIEKTYNLIALSVLFLVLLFYSTLCMSGRGIQILQRIMEKMVEIRLLGALNIKLEEENK